MITYPIIFEASAKTEPGIKTAWQSQTPYQDLECSVPKEFEGPGDGFSPEDLYLLALQNCFIATFKVFAEHSKLNYKELEVRSSLIVDRDTEARPWMDHVHLEIRVRGIDNEKKLNALISKTIESGFILRSVKTRLTHELKYES